MPGQQRQQEQPQIDLQYQFGDGRAIATYGGKYIYITPSKEGKAPNIQQVSGDQASILMLKHKKALAQQKERIESGQFTQEGSDKKQQEQQGATKKAEVVFEKLAQEDTARDTLLGATAGGLVGSNLPVNIPDKYSIENTFMDINRGPLETKGQQIAKFIQNKKLLRSTVGALAGGGLGYLASKLPDNK